jgi:hypothetical protein
MFFVGSLAIAINLLAQWVERSKSNHPGENR